VEERILGLPEEDRFDWQEIFELFHKHDVIDVEIKFGDVDEEKIREILVGRHQFSEARVEKQLEKLRDIKKQQQQKGLDKWF